MAARESATGAFLLLAGLAGFQPALAGIEPKVESGEVVFTLRPERKPGAGDAAAVRPQGRRAAPQAIENLVAEVSRRYELDSGLVSSVIGVESAYDPMAVSPKGARGLMQLMPATARRYGVQDVHDPRQNIEAGVAYLRDLLLRYSGDLRLALAAYNAGPEAVERAAGVPNYPETIRYIEKVQSLYGRKLTGGRPSRGHPDPSITPAWAGVRATRDAGGELVLTNRAHAVKRVLPRRSRVGR